MGRTIGSTTGGRAIMNHEFIRVEKREAITTITLNRPEVLNALNAGMHKELTQAFDDYAADDAQRVCVLTADGERVFCAGSDVKAASTLDPAQFMPVGYYYGGLVERVDLFKPVIAAVNGLALGGGFETVLCCDIVIASENAKFGLPEPLIGAMAAGGGVQQLPRQIGLKQAMGMILTGRHISAEEALRMGLVNEVVPAVNLRDATERWCRQILKCAPVALRASKQAALMSVSMPSLVDAVEAFKQSDGFREWLKSEDLVEGLRAFTQKRVPTWKGR
jgi:enoyl-CoA hydratase/carnithine racemase